MAEITPGSVLGGVTLSLKKFFPDAEIEVSEQPPAGGNFTLSVSECKAKRLNSMLSKYDVSVTAVYYPINNSHEDGVGVLAPIQSALSLITLPSGETLRGYEISARISEGAVQCGARYSFMLRELPQEEKMEVATIEKAE